MESRQHEKRSIEQATMHQHAFVIDQFIVLIKLNAHKECTAKCSCDEPPEHFRFITMRDRFQRLDHGNTRTNEQKRVESRQIDIERIWFYTLGRVIHARE